MKYRIAVIPGDGIGPDITAQAEEILAEVGRLFNHQFLFTHVLAGGAAIDATGTPLPEETVRVCRESDAVLLGAVGGPSGTPCRGPSGPRAAFWAYGRPWGCTPTSALPCSTMP